MRGSTARRLSRSMVGAELALFGLMSILLANTPGDRSKASNWIFIGVASVVALVYGVVGSLIVSHAPRNTIGWIFAIDALAATVSGVCNAIGIYLLKQDLGSGLGLGLAWVSNLWGAVVVTPGFVFLLFPDGHAPNARWRALGWALGVSGAIAILAFALTPDADLNNLADSGIRLANPITIGSRALMSTITEIAATVTAVLSAITVFAIRGRFKRGTPDERQQIRWLAAVGTIAGVLFTLMVLLGVVPFSDVAHAIFPVLLILFIAMLAFGIPAACTVAILKYRLYDLDVVIKKAVVFGILVVLLTVAFLFLALVLGALLSLTGFLEGSGDVIVEAFVIGALITPLWRLARRIADRAVYGGRATPYEILTRFSDHMADSYAADDVLPRMAAVVGSGTGADRVWVSLRLGGELRTVATWPQEVDRTGIQGESFEVVHQGEPLGAISLEMPAADPMNPAKARLVADLASQAGLVLRNVKLIEELRASRQRLVAAQDEERRKIERNLHDGAQQQLVALAVQLKLARQLVERDTERAGAMLDSLSGSAADALEDLRDLARGIYPPLLADKGLPAALEAQARKATVPTTVDASEVGRYPMEVEAAVYFSVLEALNNVAKYSNASRAVVALSQSNGTLNFEVRDDGAGFDAEAKAYGTGLQGMRDRLDAIGGGLRVDSSPGAGTTVTGHVPVTWGDAVG